MSRVRCKNCGKSYRYETNGCCPECGAYNRPPRRLEVQADGTVYGTERYAKSFEAEKVCYEEQTCHEEDARRVRFEKERLKAAFKGFHPKTGKRGGKESSKVSAIVVAVVTLLISIWGKMGDFSFSNFDDARGDGNMSAVYAELDEYFVLDGQEMRVTDLQILDDTLRFTVIGEEEAGVVLWGWGEDGEYELYAQEMENLTDHTIVRYTFLVENIWVVEKLTLQNGWDEVEITLDMLRVPEGESFDWQGEEVRVISHDVQWSGPSKVLDNNILTVEIEGGLNGALPELWMEDGEIPETLLPESWDGNVLRYNLQHCEPKEMTLYFHADDSSDRYWMELE